MTVVDELARGREAYRQREWLTAYKSLSLADGGLHSKRRISSCSRSQACLVGRNDDGVRALDRAYQAYRGAGEPACAARCATWPGFGLMDAGEVSRARGWFTRGRRLPRAPC